MIAIAKGVHCHGSHRTAPAKSTPATASANNAMAVGSNPNEKYQPIPHAKKHRKPSKQMSALFCQR
jgi:hypothetical protein